MYRNNETEVQHKADHLTLTPADRDVHDVISKQLGGINVFGESQVRGGAEPDGCVPAGSEAAHRHAIRRDHAGGRQSIDRYILSFQ